MNKLDAVNRILQGLGDPAVTALDTGGVTDAGEAESFLDRANIEVQREGWGANMRQQITLNLPTTKITATGGSGTFTYGSTITQLNSGATGTFFYADGDDLYVYTTSGTFNTTATNTLTSGAVTRGVPSAVTTVTTAKHAVPATTFLLVKKADCEWKILTTYGDFLYDQVEDSQDFTGNVTVDAVMARAFTDLPDWVADLVVADAAVKFQRYKRRGIIDDRFLMDQYAECRRRARRFQQQIAPVNIFATADAQRVLGNRNDGLVRGGGSFGSRIVV